MGAFEERLREEQDRLKTDIFNGEYINIWRDIDDCLLHIHFSFIGTTITVSECEWKKIKDEFFDIGEL